MILFVSCWLVLVAVCVVPGTAILKLIRADQFDRIGDRFILSVWLGVAVLSVSLLAASLVTRLSPFVGVAVATSLILLSLIGRRTRAEIKTFVCTLSPRLVAGGLVLAGGVAAYTARYVSWYDTGLYHYGSIKWLSRFGAVPGLALLHPRFGLASTWFALSAPFDAGRLESRISPMLNGLALLLVGLHLLLCLSRCLMNRARLPDWVLILGSVLLLPVTLHWQVYVSASQDVPLIVATLLVAWTIVVVCDSSAAGPVQQGGFVPDAAIIPFILSMWAVTIKASGFPLVIVSALFFLSRSGFRAKPIFLLSAIGLLLVAPMIGFQLITSGCPLFPTAVMCVEVPWKMSAPEISRLSDAILQWARWSGPTPPGANSLNWFWRAWGVWGFSFESTPWLKAAVVSLIGFIMRKFAATRKIGRWVLRIGLIALALETMFSPNNLLIVFVVCLAMTTYRQGFSGKVWLIIIGVAGTALIMFRAPTLRFGLGYTVVLWICFAATHHQALQRWTNAMVFSSHAQLSFQRVFMVLLIIGGLVVGLICVGLQQNLMPWMPALYVKREILPFIMPARMQTPAVKRERINDVEFYSPVDGNQCWAAELPCSSGVRPNDYFQMPPDLVLRDPARGIAAGFKHGNHSAP